MASSTNYFAFHLCKIFGYCNSSKNNTKTFGCYFFEMVPRQAINAIEDVLQACVRQLAVLR